MDYVRFAVTFASLALIALPGRRLLLSGLHGRRPEARRRVDRTSALISVVVYSTTRIVGALRGRANDPRGTDPKQE